MLFPIECRDGCEHFRCWESGVGGEITCVCRLLGLVCDADCAEEIECPQHESGSGSHVKC